MDDRSLRAPTLFAQTNAPLTVESSSPDLDRVARSLALCSQEGARSQLPFNVAERITALPIGEAQVRTAKVLTVAVPKDAAFDVQQQLRFYLRSDVKVIPVDRAALRRAIFIAYKGDSQGLSESMTALRSADQKLLTLLPASPAAEKLSASARFLEELIQYAVARRASDIHLVPTECGTRVAIRVGGELQQGAEPVCSGAMHQEFVQRIKVLSKLDISQRQLPQDGAFSMMLPGTVARIRVNTLPTVHGEKVALRVLTDHAVRPLDALGLPMVLLEWFEDLMERGEGGIVFVGPTGSGKSTTMYSVVQELIARGNQVVTIEDPVETLITGASQLAVSPAQGLTFPLAIRAALRQDPDALLIGEVRDRESVEAAFQLAMTGHLVMTTVHAGTVYEAILRLQRFGVDLTTIAQGLSLLISLRLVPLQPKQSASSTTASPECQERWGGERILIAEALRFDRELRTQLMSGKPIAPEQITALSGAVFLSARPTVQKMLEDGCISEATARALLMTIL